jgi:carbonic anhydrase
LFKKRFELSHQSGENQYFSEKESQGKMTSYDEIFENNRKWIEQQTAQDKDFFRQLAKEQNPDYLYIGCSDSRVTAEEMMGIRPGEAFIHRNVANLVNNVDLNVMSVINYAIRQLKVKHIIVCGHYNCGGVKAAMMPKDMGILNPWLRSIRDVYRLHKAELNAVKDEHKRYDRLVELNVTEQCINIIKTAALQLNYAKEGYPQVHGWVFDIHSGRIIDLKIDYDKILKDIKEIYNLTDNP